MKKCKRCEIFKDVSYFGRKPKNKDGLNGICKLCQKEYNSNYYLSNIEYFNSHNKNWNEKNKEEKNNKAKLYYQDNKEICAEKSKIYREKNKESLNMKKREWDEQRPTDIKRDYRNNYNRAKKLVDPLYKLKCNMRSYLSMILKNSNIIKSKKTVDIIGISFEEFKLYLESRFEDWMNWENKGLYNGELNYGWDIDHVIPLSSGKSEDELLKLNHYTNLQPLCSKINRDIKKDKYATS